MLHTILRILEYFTCNFDASACPELLYNVPINEADNEFIWSRTAGRTPSALGGVQTGPFNDRSGAGKGLFSPNQEETGLCSHMSKKHKARKKTLLFALSTSFHQDGQAVFIKFLPK